MKLEHGLKFAAFTITEILVVMLVSGILLLVVYDGVGTIRKYTNGLVSGLENDNEQLGGMERLEALFIRADSVCRSKERYMFYEDDEAVTVWKHDSFLIAEFPDGRDTLFRTVQSLSDKTSVQDYGRIDSLYVALQPKDRFVCLGFAPVVRDGRIMEMVKNEEKAYIDEIP